MPHLCIHTMNGRVHISVVYGGKHREAILGEFDYIEITDEQASMTLEMLKAWYDEDKSKTHEQRRVEEAKAAKVSDLLDRLVRIINETKHDGERENAKTLYEKVTGKPFDR